MRRPLLVLAALLLALAGPLPVASGASSNFPARIDLPDGFAPEGIEGGTGTEFFVGSLADGAIRRGDVRTGSTTPLAAGGPGRAAVGIAYEAGRDRLWVAGGGPALVGLGDVRVYDASSGRLLATYLPSPVGLLNDLTITSDAVYVTDSFVQQLVVIPLPADGSLGSGATILPLTGDMVSTAGINLNGIVDQSGVLLVGQSNTGKLFRVDPETGVTTEVDLAGATLVNADGLELRGHTLFVVRNFDNLVTVVRLGAHLASGAVIGDITSSGLDIPSTATVSAGRLWAVNARFTTPAGPSTEYWVTRLPLHP